MKRLERESRANGEEGQCWYPEREHQSLGASAGDSEG